jgi:hypothetical protein
MHLAGVHRQAGRLDEAEACCQQVLELLLGVLGDPHPRVAAAYSMLGQLAGSQNKYTQVGWRGEGASRLSSGSGACGAGAATAQLVQHWLMACL